MSRLFQNAMPEAWSQDLHAICKAYRQSPLVLMKELDALVDPANKESPLHAKTTRPNDVLDVYMTRGQLYAYRGDMAHAVAEWEIAYRIALADVPPAAPLMEEVLGIGYLHKSEMDNDVYRHPGERCIFPIRPDLRYTQTAASAKAIEYFTKYLDRKPDDLEVKWLLNLVYMTLGKHPSGVPPKYLLPLASFGSGESVGRFTDVAPQAGLNLFAMASGVIVDDFENNGLFDVVTSTYDACEPMHFFHNNGDGTFTDQAAKAGPHRPVGRPEHHPGRLQQRWLHRHSGFARSMATEQRGRSANRCFATIATGPSPTSRTRAVWRNRRNTQTAVWADINNDGFLDLFVGNETGPSQLFLNKGDGTFEDISHSAGIDRSAFTKGVAAADYDNDGYVDFYVSNLNGGNFLYHNNHNGTFTEIASQAGVPGVGRGFAAWFFDYDNDGWPDLFVTSYYASIEETHRNLPGASAESRDAEVIPEPGKRDFPGRDQRDRTGQGLHAHGRKLRRRGQRRLPRHLSRHGKSFVCLAAPECVTPEQRGQILCGRHGFFGHGRITQRTRCRLCGHR